MATVSSILVVMDKPKHDQVALWRALVLQSQTGAKLHLRAFVHDPAYDQLETTDPIARRAMKQAAMAERKQWLRTALLEAGGDPGSASQQVVWTKDIIFHGTWAIRGS